MTVFDLRATQKVYKPKTNHNRIASVELRMDSIEQSLKLILKKLNENTKEIEIRTNG